MLSGKDEKPGGMLYHTNCGCGWLPLESRCSDCGACLNCCGCKEKEPEAHHCQACGGHEFEKHIYRHKLVVCDVELREILHEDNVIDRIDSWLCTNCGESTTYEADVILDRIV